MSQKKKQDQKGSGLIVYNGPLYMSKACLLSLTPVPPFIQLDSATQFSPYKDTDQWTKQPLVENPAFSDLKCVEN